MWYGQDTAPWHKSLCRLVRPCRLYDRRKPNQIALALRWRNCHFPGKSTEVIDYVDLHTRIRADWVMNLRLLCLWDTFEQLSHLPLTQKAQKWVTESHLLQAPWISCLAATNKSGFLASSCCKWCCSLSGQTKQKKSLPLWVLVSQ